MTSINVPNAPMIDSSSSIGEAEERREYDRYLGAFFWLCLSIVIAGGGYVIANLLGGVPYALPVYPVSTILVAAAAFVIVAYYGRQSTSHIDASQDGVKITLQQKKNALLLVFSLYLFSLTILVFWTGGIKLSPFACFVPLTASLSTYVAKRRATKALVGILACVAYCLLRVWHLSPVNMHGSASQPANIAAFETEQFDIEMVMEMIAIATVTYMSAHLSGEIRKPPQLVAA